MIERRGVGDDEDWLSPPKPVKGKDREEKKKLSRSEKSVKVNCYHSGEFKDENDELVYVEGYVEVLGVKSGSIYEEVLLKMVTKIKIGKMWFKLPYQRLEDRKPLWGNMDAMQRKLNAYGRWYDEVDIYIEKVAFEPQIGLASKESQVCLAEGAVENEVNVSIEEAQIDLTEKATASNEVEVDVALKEAGIITDGEVEEVTDDSADETYDGNEENDASDDCEDGEVFPETDDESSDNDEVVEEELVVFDSNNYEDVVDDDDELYPDTDDSSGDEEEQAERLHRDGALDGVFSLRQTFNSGAEFKKQVIKYILKTQRNVVYDRWEKDKLGAKCVNAYYLTTHWQGCYQTGLRPVNGPKFWKVSGGALIEAPPYRRPPGRPKGKARIKGVNESPTKKKKTQDPHKVGRENRVIHCGICKAEGHNSRKCPTESEESRAKRRKLNEEAKAAKRALVQEEDVSFSAPSNSHSYLDDLD